MLSTVEHVTVEHVTLFSSRPYKSMNIMRSPSQWIEVIGYYLWIKSLYNIGCIARQQETN